MNTGFETFSIEHIFILIVCALITYGLIKWGLASEEPQKSDIGLVIAGLTFSALIIEAIVKLYEGNYDVRSDLPFFMCDVVAMFLPFVMLYQKRKWLGIFYFWALAGTIQALITPDLEAGFPSFHFFRYFISHAGIIAAIVYAVVVNKIKIGWQDFLQAIMYAQVYLVAVHILNQLMGSNYAYTMQKPPGDSMLNLMGPWPWYILAGELVMVLLFLILMIPFLFKPARMENEVPSKDGPSK